MVQLFAYVFTLYMYVHVTRVQLENFAWRGGRGGARVNSDMSAELHVRTCRKGAGLC